MAPEQLNKTSFPLTDDFSKIDVWASAVILIYMLTIDFPFFHAVDDFAIYSNFLQNPSSFFENHKVEFDSEAEKLEICDLL